MPRDSAGVYSLPPGYEAVTGQTIEASQHNPPLEDIASALTGSLPRNGSAPMLATLNMAGSRIISVGTPTADTDAATKAYIDAAIATAIAGINPQPVPPGTVVAYGGSAVPGGWIECGGHEVSREAFAALFAVIGTRFGAGNGTTTFNVPQLRGEFIRGFDNGRGSDPGRVLGSWQPSMLEAHAHGVNDPGHQHIPNDGRTFQTIGPGGSSPDTLGGPSQTFTTGATGVSATGITIQTTGGHETRPRNYAFYYMIKV